MINVKRNLFFLISFQAKNMFSHPFHNHFTL
ncbi:hypothetical protein [Sporosarcina sp. ANT_H38]